MRRKLESLSKIYPWQIIELGSNSDQVEAKLFFPPIMSHHSVQVMGTQERRTLLIAIFWKLKKKWKRTHTRKTCMSIASQIFQLNWIKEQNITASQIALHIPSSLFALYNLWCHSSVLPVFLNFIYMEIYKLYSTQSTGLTFPRIQMESVS